MKLKRPLCVLCWVMGLSLAAALTVVSRPADGAEPLPNDVAVTSLVVQPEAIELSHRFDYRQLLLSGATTEGATVDLTRHAKLVGQPEFVEVSANGLVTPKADGEETLHFEFGGYKASVKVTVGGVEAKYDVSFIRDVQPAFARMGCNQGTCHGAKDGKNGFKLSLRGYDPLYDYAAFTDDVAARRFNRAAPDQSLMLLKASGSIPHVGGVRTEVGSRYYDMLRTWIADGVKFDGDSPRVKSIEVLPRNPIVPRAGMRQQMVVKATYSDGSTRDVTQEAFVESGNIEVIEAEQGGLLTMLRRGEAPVLVRYEGAYAATTLTVMGDRDGFVWKDPPTNNYIDQLEYKKLERVKILPSGLCSDEDFIRRVTIDLTGLPPTADAVRAFLADKRETRVKRDALIDKLVGGREYVEHWTNKWADLLQVNRKFLGEEGAVALRAWIKDAVATNKPYDELAREVLTASGSTLENPPAAYYKVLREPALMMENTTHLFLAVRFNCNKCHDHPFERWTQDQYYDLASYFAQVGRKEDPQFAGQKIGGSAVEGATPLVEVIYDKGAGEVTHDRTGQVVSPAFPYEHNDLASNDASRREQLAQWITSPENQYFAKSYVNRLWGYLFGIGIIEPIDDIRAGNPPTNPELLDALTKDFIDSGFDVQHMMRTICKSRTYQHSIETNEWNELDEINYSHALPRRLPAEVLYDAIHVATGAPLNISGVPAGFRAAELPDVGIDVPFLDDFGRPVRESSCECERTGGVVLGPVMKLVNGPTVIGAVSHPQNALAKLVASEKDDAKLIDEVFLRFLARYPTQRERELGLQAMRDAGADYDRLAADLAKYEKEQLPARLAKWEEGLSAETTWRPVEIVEMKSQVGATFTKESDGAIFVSGKNGKDVYTITAKTDLPEITGVRIEALPDKRLAAGGPGRAQNGNFVLSELTVTAAPADKPDMAAKLTLQNGAADFSQTSWPVIAAVDGAAGSGWAVSPEFGKAHTAVFETKQDAARDGGAQLVFSLSQQYPDGTHTLGRFRLSVTGSPRPIRLQGQSGELAKLLAIPADKRSEQQQQQLLETYVQSDAEYQRLTKAVEAAKSERDNRRLYGVQDLAWALINNSAFLFNR
ncbi:MAG: DUF1549 and DUF1553 domain-containing protein [Pirellulaceae bacterium]